MKLAQQLREAAHRASSDLQLLLHQAAEELEMLRAAADDCETARTQAVAEAIHNERAGCLQIAESVRDPTGDAIAAAIRLRRSP